MASTKHKFIVSDKYCEKFKKIEVNGSMKLSIMCGLIKTTGSSSYLSDKKSTSHECAIHVRCEFLNQVKQLNTLILTEEQIGVVKNAMARGATHFVSKIHYGAGVTLMLKKSISEEKDESNAEAQLKAQLKLNACGDAFLKCLEKGDINSEGRYVASNNVNTMDIECELQCDCEISDLIPPTTFEGALEFASKLSPKLSQVTNDDEPPGVPCIVWLQPLSSLPQIKADPIVLHKIDDFWVGKYTQLVEQYDELENEVNDMLNGDLLKYKLTPVSKKLEEFKMLLTSFRKKLEAEIQNLTVAVVSGQKDDKSLEQLLKLFTSADKDNFAFHPKALGQWLKEKHIEICTVKRITDKILSGPYQALAFPDQRKLQEEMSKVNCTLVFNFTSLARPEPFLKRMETHRSADLSDIAANYVEWSSHLPEELYVSSRNNCWHENGPLLENTEHTTSLLFELFSKVISSASGHILFNIWPMISPNSKINFVITASVEENDEFASDGMSVDVYKMSNLQDRVKICDLPVKLRRCANF